MAGFKCAKHIPDVSRVEGFVIISWCINVKIIQKGMIILYKFIADVGKDRGIHVVVGVAHHVIHRQRLLYEIADRVGEVEAVYNRHGVVHVVLPAVTDFLPCSKEPFYIKCLKFFKGLTACCAHHIKPVLVSPVSGAGLGKARKGTST